MATRIKDGIIPYTGGQGIEITNNHVINVLLREMNNLIQVNGDRELYVDLQLPDGIQPSDTFPVGVTTGKILAEDGWPQSGIILNWKTTSGDYVRLIYANDGKLYYDPGTGVWRLFGCNCGHFEGTWGAWSGSTLVATDITDGAPALGTIVRFRANLPSSGRSPSLRNVSFDSGTTLIPMIYPDDDMGYLSTWGDYEYSTGLAFTGIVTDAGLVLIEKCLWVGAE